MIFGRLLNGRLTDIGYREAPAFPDDVPLDAMPGFVGLMGYDAANRAAIPLDPSALTASEKANRRDIPKLLLAAIVVRASTVATAAQKNKAQTIIDNAAANLLDIFA